MPKSALGYGEGSIIRQLADKGFLRIAQEISN